MACYILQNCASNNFQYVSYAAGTLPVGEVINIDVAFAAPDDVNCWRVLDTQICDGTETDITAFVSYGAYPIGCSVCQGVQVVRLHNCDTSGGDVYVNVNYTSFPTATFISINPMPADYLTLPNCWEVVGTGSLLPTNPVVTTVTDVISCENCTASPPCYVLRSCSAGNNNYYYTTNPAFAPYASGGLTTQIAEHPGCFTVELVGGLCDCIDAYNYTPTGEPDCTCTSNYICYILTDCLNPSFTVYTENNLQPYIGLTVSVAEYPGFCFNVSGTSSSVFCATVTKESVSCVEICICGELTYCYTLTNCEVDPTSGLPITQIVSSATPLPIINSVIIPVPAIVYPGVGNCWIVGDTYSPCTPTTGVTLTSFTNLGVGNCELCLGPPQCYKLTSCDQETIVYTTSNLSAFVNNYIQTPVLPGSSCWFVEEVEECLTPLLTITTAAFCTISCPVYTLTPCGGGTPVYTFTNLSSYVGGLPIHFDELGGCGGLCYEVTAGGLYADATAVTVSSCTTPCLPCNQACYALQDCVTKEIYAVLSNPTANGVDLSLYVNQTLGLLCLVPEADCTIGCWEIKETTNCETAISAYVYTNNIYTNCDTCRNSCYGLQDCNTGAILYTIKYTTPNPNGLPNPSTLAATSAVLGDLCFTIETEGCIEGCLQVVLTTYTDCVSAIDWTDVVSYTQYSSCYECTPKCYILTDCTGVEEPFVVNNNFSAYVDSYIKICTADACKCYFVELATSCDGSITVGNPSATFVTCEDCRSCGCPPGYTQNGDICEKITTIPATLGETVYTVQPGSRNIDYGTYGTNFYTPNLSTLPYPIVENGTGNFQDAATNVLTDININTGVWGPGFSTSRLNNIGVWSGAAPNPVDEWIGFTHCLNLDTTGTYSIGIAGDNKVRLKIDGILVVEANNNTDFNFKYWHVFETTLTQGLHVIELSGLNLGGAAAFGAEIYNQDLATLQTYTTALQLQLATVFSTYDKIGSTFDVGQASGYTCPDGYTFSNCTADGPSCTIIESVPFVICLPTYKVTDCTGLQIPFITNTDLSQYVGGVWKTCIENPEYSTDCYFLQDCNRVYPDIYSFTDLSAYVWQSVELNGYPGGCFIVNGIPVGSLCRDAIDVTVTKTCTCPDAQTPWPDGCYCVTVEEVDYSIGTDFIGDFGMSYICCEDCTRICYILRPCVGDLTPVTVCNDLSAYVGKVIKITGCGDICWTVEESIYPCSNGLFIEGQITEFLTCDACLPPVPPTPPLVLHPRKIKPGYNSPNSNISTDYIEKVNCTFAEQVYNQMLVNRYGITVCCNEDLTKWDIKKQVLDFELLIDPSLCRSTICYCPEPCFISAIITVLPTCVAPYLIRATLDPLCIEPVVESVEITVESNLPCYCYTVEVLDEPITVGYIDCCCRDVIAVYDAVTTFNACAIYPPVSNSPSSINVTSSGLCSDECVVPPPVCVCWRVMNTGFTAGEIANFTYIPCDSTIPVSVTFSSEHTRICSYNMPTGTNIGPINEGPCTQSCTDIPPACVCYAVTYVGPTCDFVISSCKTGGLETIAIANGSFVCSYTIPVPTGSCTGLSDMTITPTGYPCDGLGRCIPPSNCMCYQVEMPGGATTPLSCNGSITSFTAPTTGLYDLCTDGPFDPSVTIIQIYGLCSDPSTPCYQP